MIRLFGLVVLATLAVVLMLAPTEQAESASIPVTRFDDPIPDGCQPIDCSLREAIIEANTLAGADTIDLAAGTYTLTIPGEFDNASATGDLDITESLTLSGVGAGSTVINGGGVDRVIQIIVNPSDTVTIEDLAIRNGEVVTGGGGIDISSGSLVVLRRVLVDANTGSEGGGISNYGTLTLLDSTVSNNVQLSVGGAGGVSNLGTLTIDGSTISGNSTEQFGGGVVNGIGANLTLIDSVVSSNTATSLGGGVFNNGTMDVTRTTIDGNNVTMGVGGGVSNSQQGVMTIADSTVSTNSSIFAGGGMYLESGELQVTNSLIEANSTLCCGGGLFIGGGNMTLAGTAVVGNSASFGGGIYTVVGSSVAGSLTVTDSTIDSNTATGIMGGGGIFFEEGAATLTGSTISNNEATSGAGGGIWGESAELTLTNTTVSGNTAMADGGGIALCYCIFRNTTVSNNVAGGVGGGLMLGSETVINSCCLDAGNTIIAGNSDFAGLMPNLGCTSSSQLISQGYNLIEDIYLGSKESPGCTITGDTTGNIIGVPALLGPLANNSGPTLTHRLPAGSPALDAGNPPPAWRRRLCMRGH